MSLFLGVDVECCSVAVDVAAPWPELGLWRPIVLVAAADAAAFVFAAATSVVASTNPPTFQNLFVGEQSEVVVGQELHVQPQEVPLVTGSYITDALSVDFDSLP